MNIREMYAEVTRLAKERNWPEGSQLETHLMSLMSARDEARCALLSSVRALRNDLDRLDAILGHPSPLLNTLGELQNHPSAVEARVGAFAAADRALREFLETFPAGEPELKD